MSYCIVYKLRKNWNHSKILLKTNKTQQTSSKCYCTETTSRTSVHTPRQLARSAGQRGHHVLHLPCHFCLPRMIVPHPNLPFLFFTLLLQQGGLHSYTSDTLEKYLSMSGHKIFQFKQHWTEMQVAQIVTPGPSGFFKAFIVMTALCKS